MSGNAQQLQAAARVIAAKAHPRAACSHRNEGALPSLARRRSFRRGVGAEGSGAEKKTAMSEHTETTTNDDGSVTTVTYDENGNVTCTSTVSGPGAAEGPTGPRLPRQQQRAEGAGVP